MLPISLLLALQVAASNSPDPCTSLLKDGVFNQVIRDTRRSAKENLAMFLASSSYQEARSAIAAGLSAVVPIEGVPVELGGNYSESDHQRIQNALRSGRTQSSEVITSEFLLTRTVDPVLVRGFVECQDRSGLSSTILGAEDRNMFVVRLRYRATKKGDPGPRIIAKPILSQGSSLEGFPNELPFEPEWDWSFAVRRDDKRTPLTVLLNTSAGTIYHRIPSYQPPPPPCPVGALETFRSTYNAKMNGITELDPWILPPLNINVTMLTYLAPGQARIRANVFGSSTDFSERVVNVGEQFQFERCGVSFRMVVRRIYDEGTRKIFHFDLTET